MFTIYTELVSPTVKAFYDSLDFSLSPIEISRGKHDLVACGRVMELQRYRDAALDSVLNCAAKEAEQYLDVDAPPRFGMLGNVKMNTSQWVIDVVLREMQLYDRKRGNFNHLITLV